MFPAAPLVLSACMYGPSASPRLLRLGAEWAAWMFKHAPAHQLRAMAGPLLQRLLGALGLSAEAAADGQGEDMQVCLKCACVRMCVSVVLMMRGVQVAVSIMHMLDALEAPAAGHGWAAAAAAAGGTGPDCSRGGGHAGGVPFVCMC
jgi:hypothetical protein